MAPITIYSAHDTTVFSLLAAIGATREAELPDFAASVVVELWQTKGEMRGEVAPSPFMFNVRVFYNGKPLQGLEWCPNGECTLHMFTEGTRSSFVKREECKRKGVSAGEQLSQECCPSA